MLGDAALLVRNDVQGEPHDVRDKSSNARVNLLLITFSTAANLGWFLQRTRHCNRDLPQLSAACTLPTPSMRVARLCIVTRWCTTQNSKTTRCPLANKGPTREFARFFSKFLRVKYSRQLITRRATSLFVNFKMHKRPTGYGNAAVTHTTPHNKLTSSIT